MYKKCSDKAVNGEKSCKEIYDWSLGEYVWKNLGGVEGAEKPLRSEKIRGGGATERIERTYSEWWADFYWIEE